MKERYLKYYQHPSGLAPLVFSWAALRAKSKVAKLSLMNRQKDYQKLGGNPELFKLHLKLNELILEASREWKSYDYGEGYFYQGCSRVGITGLRDTDARVNAMRLNELLKGKSVFEIGCNSGFLTSAISDAAERVVGFDINPYLIRMAELVAGHLDQTNLEFSVDSFEHVTSGACYDAVLSFANHSTYDGNTQQSIAEYFKRCKAFLKPGGILVFESHPPEHEGDGLEGVCGIIGDLFEIIERRILDDGTFLDRGRTFMVAENRTN